MALPERPNSRVENYLANLVDQDTAWEPGNPESRVEQYLDYILENGTKSEQDMEDEIAALKSIGRYLSLWNGATGKPVTDPKKLPYKYKAGDYYIISNIGATNYMPSGTQYEGNASSTIDADAKVYDYYVFDGTTWSRLSHTESSGGGVAVIYGTGTATVNNGIIYIPINLTVNELGACISDGKFIKPIYVNTPYIVNALTGEYSYNYAGHTEFVLVSSFNMLIGDKAFSNMDNYNYYLAMGSPEIFYIVVRTS